MAMLLSWCLLLRRHRTTLTELKTHGPSCIVIDVDCTRVRNTRCISTKDTSIASAPILQDLTMLY